MIHLRTRSYEVYDVFSRHFETAHWPDGKDEPTCPGILYDEVLRGKRAIYSFKDEQLESLAGGIKFHFQSRKDDLSNPRVFDEFQDEFKDTLASPGPYWSSEHRSSKNKYRDDAYPQLKVPGDNPTWDVRYKSSGNWAQLPRTRTLFEFVIPYWSLVLVMLIPSMGMLSALARRIRRRGKNQCIYCGYDLRATPERCPECGHRTAGAANFDN